jgi:hypothetical protein
LLQIGPLEIEAAEEQPLKIDKPRKYIENWGYKICWSPRKIQYVEIVNEGRNRIGCKKIQTSNVPAFRLAREITPSGTQI